MQLYFLVCSPCRVKKLLLQALPTPKMVPEQCILLIPLQMLLRITGTLETDQPQLQHLQPIPTIAWVPILWFLLQMVQEVMEQAPKV